MHPILKNVSSELVGKPCPMCQHGSQVLMQLNLEEAVLVCSGERCSYPFSFGAIESYIIRRDFRQVPVRKRKKASSSNSSSSLAKSSRSSSPGLNATRLLCYPALPDLTKAESTISGSTPVSAVSSGIPNSLESINHSENSKRLTTPVRSVSGTSVELNDAVLDAEASVNWNEVLRNLLGGENAGGDMLRGITAGFTCSACGAAEHHEWRGWGLMPVDTAVTFDLEHPVAQTACGRCGESASVPATWLPGSAKFAALRFPRGTGSGMLSTLPRCNTDGSGQWVVHRAATLQEGKVWVWRTSEAGTWQLCSDGTTLLKPPPSLCLEASCVRKIIWQLSPCDRENHPDVSSFEANYVSPVSSIIRSEPRERNEVDVACVSVIGERSEVDLPPTKRKSEEVESNSHQSVDKVSIPTTDNSPVSKASSIVSSSAPVAPQPKLAFSIDLKDLTNLRLVPASDQTQGVPMVLASSFVPVLGKTEDILLPVSYFPHMSLPSSPPDSSATKSTSTAVASVDNKVPQAEKSSKQTQLGSNDASAGVGSQRLASVSSDSPLSASKVAKVERVAGEAESKSEPMKLLDGVQKPVSRSDSVPCEKIENEKRKKVPKGRKKKNDGDKAPAIVEASHVSEKSNEGASSAIESVGNSTEEPKNSAAVASQDITDPNDPLQKRRFMFSSMSGLFSAGSKVEKMSKTLQPKQGSQPQKPNSTPVIQAGIFSHGSGETSKQKSKRAEPKHSRGRLIKNLKKRKSLEGDSQPVLARRMSSADVDVKAADRTTISEQPAAICKSSSVPSLTSMASQSSDSKITERSGIRARSAKVLDFIRTKSEALKFKGYVAELKQKSGQSKTPEKRREEKVRLLDLLNEIKAKRAKRQVSFDLSDQVSESPEAMEVDFVKQLESLVSPGARASVRADTDSSAVFVSSGVESRLDEASTCGDVLSSSDLAEVLDLPVEAILPDMTGDIGNMDLGSLLDELFPDP